MREVHLVLSVCVLVVELQHVEAAALERVLQLQQQRHLADEALQVVARFVEAVTVVGGRPACAVTFQQKELGLDADLQRPVLAGQSRDLARQHLARAGVEGLAGDEAFADDAGHAGQPRQRLRGARHAARVVLGALAGAREAGAPDRRAGETGAGDQHVVQMRQRHQLAARRAVDVGELHQQAVHALRCEAVADGFHGVMPRASDSRQGCPTPRRTPACVRRQREQEAHDVGVDAAGQQDQVALERFGLHALGEVGVGLALRVVELDGDHRAQAAHVGDLLDTARLQAVEHAFELLAEAIAPRSGSCSSAMTSITACAAAIASGLPA